MSEHTFIKTTISTNETYDEDGKFLPAGSYYFEIHSYRNGLFVGELSNRGSYGLFVFRPPHLIRMMSVGQARLARRCNLREPGMPTYSSPVQRQRRRLPLLNVPPRSAPLPRSAPQPPPRPAPRNPQPPTRNPPRPAPRPPSPVICSICLDPILHHNKTLSCNHSFHQRCIDRWFQTRSSCPNCRRSQTRRLPQISRLQEPVFRPSRPSIPSRRQYVRRRSSLLIT